jgi:hypothetical protein
MPFSVKRYGTRAKFAKMKRCVASVSASGSKVNPFAVCRASIYPKDKNYEKGFKDAQKGVMPPAFMLFRARMIPSGYLRGWMDARERRRR